MEIKINAETTKNVLEYIKNNWVNSIRPANDVVPYPFTSPSITGFFKDFFYWDNYFINRGLMLDGIDYQVKNNLDNFAYFINILGFMPNCTNTFDRTQPPLFTKCVWEYYQYKKDKEILTTYLPYILKEYNFWMTERIMPCGLNKFFCTATEGQLLFNYNGISSRVEEYGETKEEKLKIATDILTLAESGLDFNMRFWTDESKIDVQKFIQLDINCFLYDVEKTIEKMFLELNDKKRAKAFNKLAEKRKGLVNKYLFDKEKGIYLDYNFVEGKFSRIVSAVSLYPYVYGISDDKEGAKKVAEMLELPFGLTPCAFRGEDAFYFQWDYPCVWPYTTWFAYTALNNVGLTTDARRLAEKYMYDVNINFEKTGRIWEKYDGRDGSIAVTNEYETPEMLGWSAGAYRIFAEELGYRK